MNSIHYRIECEKHGTLLGQCRCPAQNKATRTVPCSWKCPEYVKPLGLCQRCEHPASWHRLDDSTNVSPTDPNASSAASAMTARSTTRSHQRYLVGALTTYQRRPDATDHPRRC